MKILADESVDGAIVRWLRGAGHDVRWIAEESPGRDDAAVARRAWDELRFLVTADRDFGTLVIRHGLSAAGVLLIRIRASSAAQLMSEFQRLWPAIESKLCGNFLVASRGRLRVRPLER